MCWEDAIELAKSKGVFDWAYGVLSQFPSVKKHIDSMVPGKTKAGGWSQMRYQRRRDKQVKEFAKDVANAAEKIFSAENIKRIFLGSK